MDSASAGGLSNGGHSTLKQLRPAQVKESTFGNDEDLSGELPPNWSLRKFQDEVKLELQEYFVSLAVNDTIEHIRELLSTCPSEADELGVLAIRAALENPNSQKATVSLLQGLSEKGAVPRPALIRSFEKLFVTWEDITMDAPTTPFALLGILQGCIEAKMVEAAILTKLPENLLQAGLNKAEEGFKATLEKVAKDLAEFKKEVGGTLEEFFVSLTAAEVEAFIKQLDKAAFHHELVKKAMALSFSQSDVEAGRESTLSLLGQLNSDGVLSKDDLQWGVTRLLGQLDDMALDCPRCAELATEFLSCMVADELVSVPFLRRCRLLRIGGATGLQVLDGAQRRTPEYSKKNLGVAQFKREIHTMILEYFNSGDEAEFASCVRELAPLSAAQSAELIRKVMVFAMERSGDECEMALKLLVYLHRNEELDDTAMENGFNEHYSRMPDLLLDVPDAEDMTRAFVVEAKKANILDEEWSELER